MAVAGFDRIRQTSTSTGTGAIALSAVAGFRTFSAEFSPGELIPYVIEGRTAGGVYDNQWEVGIGTLSGGQLQRTTPTNSASGVGTAHSFTSASLIVVCGFTQGGVELIIKQQQLTVTNKVLSDSSVAFADNSDNTKTMKFQLSGVTTGTERTLTVPNASGTIALLTDIPSGYAWGTITGTLSAQSDLQSALDAKVSLTGAESLTNKLLEDETTQFFDNVDNTKRLRFQLSGIGTGQTRVVTIPNKSGTMAMLDDITGGGGVWGTITGTLADQTDLQTALNLKANAADLTSHTGATTAHGTTSAIVGISDTQTLSNKSFVDANTLIVDDVDPTKRARFEAANLGAGVTRVYTMPDKNGTLAMLDDIVGGGGGAAWGTITGAISSQTDLWAYLSVQADLSTAQTLTNKSLVDASTYLIDEIDATKRAQFQLSGIATATTRTITLPNKSGTMAMLDDIVGGSAPPFNKGLVTSVGLAEVWVNPLINDDGDIMTANLAVLHENTVSGSDSQHNLQTTADGVHSVVARIYSNESARLSESWQSYDVGKIVYQVDNSSYWILGNHSPTTWHEISNNELIISLAHNDTIDGSATPVVDNYTDVAFNDPSCRILRLNPDVAEFNLTGLQITADGRLIHIQNVDTVLGFFLMHEAGTSTAQNRFSMPGGVNYYIPPRSGVSVVYDGSISRWRPIGGQVLPLLLNGGTQQIANTVTIGLSSKFIYTSESTVDILHQWEGHSPVVSTCNDPFTLAVVGTGVINNASYPITDTINDGRNNAITIRSSATANTGARIFTENLAIVLGVDDGGGGVAGMPYEFQCRFMMNDTVTGRVLRFGFHDASTATDAVDGAYIELSTQTIKGKTASNSTRSTTATTFTYAAGVWYIGRVTTDGSGYVYFSITTASDGVEVWTDYLGQPEGANYPLAFARAVGASFIATNTPAAAANICAVSYIAFGTQQAWTKKIYG